MYPEESEIIAEAHFKLSLALEFASITRTKEEGDDKPAEAEEHLDQVMRDEAVTQLELAIKSTKLKLQNKEVELASSHDPDENEMLRAQIAEVKEICGEMEGRVCYPTLLSYREFVFASDSIGRQNMLIAHSSPNSKPLPST